MYEAIIDRRYLYPVTIGPTDTRDEASRLARQWLVAAPESERKGLGSITIGRVPEERKREEV